MPPAIARRRRDRVGMATSSRKAAIGGMREARTAGARAATTVTRTPMSRPTITVRGSRTSPPVGISAPMAAKSACRPNATAMPTPSPSTAPTSPTPNDSAISERTICPRVAPSARSSASSRLRWATSMENVLRMMKLPTNSAMPAKTRRKISMKARPEAMSSAALSAASCPVRTVAASPMTARTEAASTSCVTPSAATTSISVYSSRPPSSNCCA